eukprot:NODE_1289_length_2028_cov_18.284514_g1092_i0.p1 GENE.NODE_1289_length_2028_cov_18.284514_g1092_i0~~NODE_1289_length_2028_cov_18.284514_g1092_i0.p1  ORF type:complete len:344 (-),score=76.34 NODE_1289_length_2028_cov_18.284514_g1092_i0:927-1958(-)
METRRNLNTFRPSPISVTHGHPIKKPPAPINNTSPNNCPRPPKPITTPSADITNDSSSTPSCGISTVYSSDIERRSSTPSQFSPKPNIWNRVPRSAPVQLVTEESHYEQLLDRFTFHDLSSTPPAIDKDISPHKETKFQSPLTPPPPKPIQNENNWIENFWKSLPHSAPVNLVGYQFPFQSNGDQEEDLGSPTSLDIESPSGHSLSTPPPPSPLAADAVIPSTLITSNMSPNNRSSSTSSPDSLLPIIGGHGVFSLGGPLPDQQKDSDNWNLWWTKSASNDKNIIPRSSTPPPPPALGPSDKPWVPSNEKTAGDSNQKASPKKDSRRPPPSDFIIKLIPKTGY